MTIRDATHDDVPAVVEMARRFRATSPYQDLILDSPDAIAATVTRLVDGPASVVLVLEHEDRLVGMIGMLTYPHFLDGVLTAGEVAWWVEPEARGGTGRQLLEAAEAWAAAQGAVRVQMIAPDTRVGQLYERAGYHLCELAYQKRVGRPSPVMDEMPVATVEEG